MALYADDVLVYLSNPDISLPKLFDFLEEYGRFSGYKLNKENPNVIIWFQSNKRTQTTIKY